MSPFVAEFLGTAILVLLGNGVVANCVLNQTKGQNAGWMVITSAWAFAVFTAVLITTPFSGAHLNPAVSIGLACAGLFAWSQVASYIIAQVLGAMCGAFLVYLFYQAHFAITKEEASKRACFCTEPAIRKPASNFFSEMIGTFVLVFAVFYIAGADIRLSQDPNAMIGLGSIGAIPVAFVVWSIGLSLGGTTGYAINPARDFGPRMVLQLLKSPLKTSADWAYAPIPVFAPIAGALLAALLFKIIA